MKYNFDEVVDRRGSDAMKWLDLDEANGEILPMWIADMDFKAADEILEALSVPIQHGVLGYNAIPDSFYQSMINWTFEKHGWKIKKEWLVFTPGVVPGLSTCVTTYTDEGDSVLVQPPVYPPFFRVMTNNKRNIVENPLVHDGSRHLMDLKDIESKIDETTKLALLCNPHNPVGRVWERSELEAFGNVCLENNIIIVSDEIHCDLAFKDHKHIPLASISEELAQNTITFMAPSKTFNIAGLFSSVAIIQNEELRNAYVESMEAMELTHVSIFGAVGFEAAYTHGKDWLDQVLEYVEDNADFAVDYIAKNIPQIKTYKPEGTYLLWLDFNALGKSPAEIDEILVGKGRIRLNDGSPYGTGGEGFFRLNIGCPRKVLIEGLERIERALK